MGDAELTSIAERSAGKLEFILAVPGRYAELVETFRVLAFGDGVAESTLAGHRLIVAHDPLRAEEQFPGAPEPGWRGWPNSADRNCWSSTS